MDNSNYKSVVKFNLLSFNKLAIDNNTVIYCKGKPFYQGKLVDLSLKTPSTLWTALSSLSMENIKDFSLKIQGSFAFVIETKNSVFLLSDYIRSFPIFYSMQNQEISISEKLNYFLGGSINSLNVSNLITSGYVFGNETIYQNVKSIQPAEFLLFDKKNETVNSSRYFKFVPSQNTTFLSVESFVDKYTKTMELILKRIILSAPICNNWIVPLSGGHDSRQIVNTLVRLGVTNVICFTYGKVNNHQAVLSQKVAQAVGYEWYFVEYSEEKWFELHRNGLIDDYLDYSYQGNSIPHFQDFLAIYELTSKGIITKDDIVLPGHALDMISGSHFNDVDLECNDQSSAVERTLLKHSKCKDLSLIKSSTNFRTLSKIYDEINISPVQFQEYINWQERQAKFIVNSCRIYEFFDLEFRLPFWEREIIDLFLSLPSEQRVRRKFYLSAERQGILIESLSQIPFEDETNKKVSKIGMKQKMLAKTPTIMRAVLSRLIRSKVYEAESLNQIFALKGNTVEDVVGSVKLFPKDTHSFIKPLMIRNTHRTSNELLTGLYAMSRILKK